MNIPETDQAYIAHTYKRFPLTITEGKGSLCWDENGREYIDLGSGIGVNIFGFQDEVWKEAVIRQLNTLQHASNLYYTRPCALLAEKLCQKTGMQKVFFSNSGAEANECAIKAARKYAEEKYGEDACTIVTLADSFHGRTLATLAATGQDMFHHDFLPLPPGFVYARRNDLEGLKELVSRQKTAAIMIECVQGEGGVHVLDQEFVEGIGKICQEQDILLIVDEVQSGNGRSGAMYAYMRFGLHPDIVTTAKGLAGGLPMGATLFSSKVQDVFQPGDHGSTFGGNPVAAAGAVSIVDRLDGTMLEGVNQRSRYLFDLFSGMPGLKRVEGLGLMFGVEPEGKKASDVVKACMDRGVLLLTAHDNCVRLLPALNIPMDLLEKAALILKEELAS